MTNMSSRPKLKLDQRLHYRTCKTISLVVAYFFRNISLGCYLDQTLSQGMGGEIYCRVDVEMLSTTVSVLFLYRLLCCSVVYASKLLLLPSDRAVLPTNHQDTVTSHPAHLVVALLGFTVLSLQDLSHHQLQALHLRV